MSTTIRDLVDGHLAGLPKEPSRDDVLAALRGLASSLNGHPADWREAVRQEAVERLTSLGVAPLDARALVKKALAPVEAAPSNGQGRALALNDAEPWPDAVGGAELAVELASTFARYVALPDGAATALTLWTLHAHAHDAAEVSPILALTSPEKRCGKTTALLVLSAVAPRPLIASSLTPAVLYRAVEGHRPTLLVDEADTFLPEHDELRGILNAGHVRRTAVVPRCVGDDHETKLFSSYCPKVVALIGNLPGTLEDRALIIRMRRKAASEQLERLRLDRLEELQPIARRARRWAVDHLDVLRHADPAVPDALHDRAQDNWRPLLAIAEVLGRDWPERARRAALALAGGEPSSLGELLLADLRDLFSDRGVDRLASADIVAALGSMEHRPWPEFSRGKPITARGLARLLSSFGVRPDSIRVTTGTVKGYAIEQFVEPWGRYLPSDPEQRNKPHPERPERDFRSGTDSERVPDEKRTKPAPLAACSVVPDEGGGEGEGSLPDLHGHGWEEAPALDLAPSAYPTTEVRP